MRNKQIDGLRGFTILLIVIFHLFCRYREIYCGYTIWYLKWLGMFGNCVFLLISSYFLIGVLGKRTSIKKFIIKKVFRLWPCYIVAITLTMVFTHIFKLPYRTCSWKEYFINVFFINGFIESNYVDGAHWYLTTLIGAIIVVWVIKNFKIDNYVWTYLVWILLEGITGVVGLGALNKILGSSYVAVICIGIAISIMEQKSYKIQCLYKITGAKRYLRTNQWLILVVVCIVYHLFRNGVLAMFCLCLAIPFFLATLCKKGEIFERKFFEFMGKISYPLYLIHQNIAYTIEYTISKQYIQISLNIIAGGAFLLVIVVGIVLYYFIEKPSQRMIQNCKLLK